MNEVVGYLWWSCRAKVEGQGKWMFWNHPTQVNPDLRLVLVQCVQQPVNTGEGLAVLSVLCAPLCGPGF